MDEEMYYDESSDESFADYISISSDITETVEDPDFDVPVEEDEATAEEDEATVEYDDASSREANEEVNEENPNPAEVEPRLPEEIKPNEASVIRSPKESSEEDGQNCSICFEPWTSASEHRLVSLRCGHLFGRSCISRWLKGQNARCPQCNARARKYEIRNIYAKAVKVLDSSERDKALADLSKESELRRQAEMVAAQERLKHMMAVQECERLKKELMEANKLLQEYRSAGAPANCSSQFAKSNPLIFTLEKCIDIAKKGGCRIVDSSDLLGMILVSQPSTNELFSGFGFRKISTTDLKPSEFVLVHQKPIRDMSFHCHDALVLTASLDKTFRITNVLTNSVVQTYNVPSDAWCCGWDSDDPIYFYGGVKTGEVYVYDIRCTSGHVYELPRFGFKTPVVSLQYLRNPTHRTRLCGPMIGKLSDCAFYEKTATPNEHKILPLPTLGTFTSLSAEPTSGHFLVSCRPSSKQPRVNHTLCEIVMSRDGSTVCNPVQTVLGGKAQVQLTRSKLLKHPENDSSLLLCAGDEDARGALVWDGSSGSQVARLQTDLPVLDLNGLNINHKSVLTVLTDKNLRFYSWTGQ